ncbi:Zn-ribbon domain-containing OB-fold protein [Azospirillum sp. INR13]|uniref:Zn-ribbon domain-containing OB-fold protein n=1 Tax=Azospirillum sp. INR13 TaxID=2596919 RepID=UPI0018923E18|nr:Zn-ribbon domain-containing OB-fold protein [Azospirillum sp. INR13]MBF5094149.1 Zn-ribbon domain-containing OB-fold protein [Azospirillum sp. INR13]
MPRKLPLLNPENTAFWTGGADGELRIAHCDACGTLFHPPTPVCPACASLDVGYKPVSGRARVVTFTVNHQAWTPELAEPYVIAIVEIVEQAGVRFLTNIVGCPVDRVRIGMPVRVTFEPIDDVWIPLFVADE